MEPQVLIAARDDFSRKDPAQMAGLSQSEYLPDRQALRLCYLNKFYEVFYPSGKILGDQAGELTRDEEALLLQYLSQASGAPQTGRWIAFAELPSGMLHDTPFRAEGIAPLVQVFEGQPQQLIMAARRLGGAAIKLAGDVAVAIPVLPRIMLAVTLWLGDGEFPAKANILFDAVSPRYLSTASLFVLGVDLTVHLRRQVDGQE